MATDYDRMLLRILRRYPWVASDPLEMIDQARPPDVPLGQALVAQGQLTEAQLTGALRFLAGHLRVEWLFPAKIRADGELLRIISQLGLAPADQVAAARLEHYHLRDAGHFVAATHVLVLRQGLLPADARQLIETHIRRVIGCGHCGKSFFMEHVTPGQSYQCRECGSPIALRGPEELAARRAWLLDLVRPEGPYADVAALLRNPVIGAGNDAPEGEAIAPAAPVPMFAKPGTNVHDLGGPGEVIVRPSQRLRAIAPEPPAPRAEPAAAAALPLAASHTGPRPADTAEPLPLLGHDGEDLTSLSGTVVGSYRLLSVLGRGRLSVTFFAAAPQPESACVLKLYPATLAGNREFAMRLREGLAEAAALRHRHIVAPRRVEAAAGRLFAVTEALESESLAARRGRTTAIDANELIPIMLGVVRALEYAHGCGVVHGTLHPGNVLLTARNEPSLTDFGLAPTLAVATREWGVAIANQPASAYLAPEQQAGEVPNTRSDLYSFGATFYDALTGVKPARATRESGVVLSHERLHQMPPDLARIIRQCLAPDPANRATTARAVRIGLELLWGGGRRHTDTVRLEGKNTAGRPCPGCAGTLEESAIECVTCGQQFCPACQRPLLEDFEHCLACGFHPRESVRDTTTLKSAGHAAP